MTFIFYLDSTNTLCRICLTIKWSICMMGFDLLHFYPHHPGANSHLNAAASVLAGFTGCFAPVNQSETLFYLVPGNHRTSYCRGDYPCKRSVCRKSVTGINGFCGKGLTMEMIKRNLRSDCHTKNRLTLCKSGATDCGGWQWKTVCGYLSVLISTQRRLLLYEVGMYHSRMQIERTWVHYGQWGTRTAAGNWV